ncbi:ImmA/IrrE family metallo-endopeptidase [Thalassoporum mexicanum]|uniref:ImmA/IrrE family metallo-endopeptidase n=1 Tax=Thalassoporum mexicanum TaxID=3457544 RepID=UPI000684A234|nr:ImmA/IrrE family metallo-endopeptidase [Pseudanabaena sp. PCC 7367]
MALRRGFKTEANEYAREYREELGLPAHSHLCPWELAELLDIPIISISELDSEHNNYDLEKHVNYLTNIDYKCFSAVTVFDGYRRIIVHNDSHSPKRQSSNVAHELAHGILQHPPTVPFSECGCRNLNKEIEDEANWLGPALLISEEAALHTADSAIEYDMIGVK